MKIIASNKKAYFNYFIEQTYEAGISLVGSEVKSIRAGNVNLNDAYVSVSNSDEIFVKNMYIKPYEKSTTFTPNDRQPHKLLLNKAEIKKLHSKVAQSGFTIVPTKLYFKGQLVKLEIALAKGKHTYDKRDVLAEKDNKRDLERTLKTLKQSH